MVTSLLSGGDFLQGSQNNLAWLFNLNPSKNSSNLSAAFQSGTAATAFQKGPNNGHTLSPFAAFDLGFRWSSQNRFEAGDTAVYLLTITGGGLTAADFNHTNADGYYSAAHIQGIGPSDGSSKIYDDGPTAGPSSRLLPRCSWWLRALRSCSSAGS